MGRRSRKRAARAPEGRPPAERSVGAGPERPTGRRRRRGEPPPAPWGSFPLVELCILLGIILGVVGIAVGGRRGPTMVGAGLALASLAGLELSIREHLAGYRSHTTLLSGVVAVAISVALFFTRAPIGLVVGAAVIVFAGAFFLLRELFKRRSGGFGFR